MEVYTDDYETEEWLWEFLVARQRLVRRGEQVESSNGGTFDSTSPNCENSATSSFLGSELGLLFNVCEDGRPSSEVLLYAASQPLASQHYATSGLITPPRSSSPLQQLTANDTHSPPIRVFAQTLRSYNSAVQFIQALPSPCTSDVDNNFCTSLPEQHETSSSVQTRAEAYQPLQDISRSKRPDFDTASTTAQAASERMKRRGGKSVAQIMASTSANGIKGQTTGLPAIGAAHKSAAHFHNEQRMGRRESPLLSRPGSRAASRPGTSSSARGNHDGPDLLSTSATQQDHSRRTSQYRASCPLPSDNQVIQGSAANKASISSVETGSLAADMLPAPLSAPLPAMSSSVVQTAQSGFSARNKTVLSRVVLAALRMWGYSGSSSAVSNGVATTVTTDAALPSEDFKALYHATYSAAKFALRHAGWDTCSLEQDQMRGAVERVLEVFLGSPQES